jgi:hypothetical protein
MCHGMPTVSAQDSGRVLPVVFLYQKPCQHNKTLDGVQASLSWYGATAVGQQHGAAIGRASETRKG